MDGWMNSSLLSSLFFKNFVWLNKRETNLRSYSRLLYETIFFLFIFSLSLLSSILVDWISKRFVAHFSRRREKNEASYAALSAFAKYDINIKMQCRRTHSKWEGERKGGKWQRAKARSHNLCSLMKYRNEIEVNKIASRAHSHTHTPNKTDRVWLMTPVYAQCYFTTHICTHINKHTRLASILLRYGYATITISLWPHLLICLYSSIRFQFKRFASK